MASRGEGLFGPLCQEVATHNSALGRRCEKHAEELIRSMRDPSMLLNVIAGRARTEDEIKRLIKRIRIDG